MSSTAKPENAFVSLNNGFFRALALPFSAAVFIFVSFLSRILCNLFVAPESSSRQTQTSTYATHVCLRVIRSKSCLPAECGLPVQTIEYLQTQCRSPHIEFFCFSLLTYQ